MNQKNFYTIKFVKSEKLKKGLVIATCLFALVQMLFIFLINFLKYDQLIDYDSSLALRHCIEMWKKGHIFFDEFYYSTTLEIDNAAFFAIPFLFIFGNLGVGLGICHCIAYLLFLFICCDIFSNLGFSKMCGVLSTILVFTPYAFGQLDWSNMIFLIGGQYEFRILTMILLIDLMLACEMNASKRKILGLSILCAAINFWTSLSSGNYVLLMIIFPVLIWLFIKGVDDNAWHFKKNQLLLLLANCLISALGWKLHDHFGGNTIRNNLNVISAQSFFDNIGNAITGIFMLFGGINHSGSISVLSLRGMVMIMKTAFILCCVVYIIISIVKLKKNNLLNGLFLAVALVNLAVLFLTNTVYGSSIFEYRYHILWASLLLLCIGEIYVLYEKFRYGNIMLMGLYALIFIFNVCGFRDILKTPDQNTLSKEILQIAEEQGYEAIYLHDMMLQAAQIRALDQDMYCISFTFNGQETPSAVIYDFYTYYQDNASAGKRNILVAARDQFEILPVQYKEKYQEIASLSNGLIVYGAEENGWDFISGLPGEAETATDFVYSPGYRYAGELSNGKLVAKGANDFVLFGPYAVTKKGTYDVILHYSAGLTGNSWADICVDGGTKQLVAKNLNADSDTLVFENVEIPGDTVIEFRVWAAEGSSFTIEKIVINKAAAN